MQYFDFSEFRFMIENEIALLSEIPILKGDKLETDHIVNMKFTVMVKKESELVYYIVSELGEEVNLKLLDTQEI